MTPENRTICAIFSPLWRALTCCRPQKKGDRVTGDILNRVRHLCCLSKVNESGGLVAGIVSEKLLGGGAERNRLWQQLLAQREAGLTTVRKRSANQRIDFLRTSSSFNLAGDAQDPKLSEFSENSGVTTTVFTGRADEKASLLVAVQRRCHSGRGSKGASEGAVIVETGRLGDFCDGLFGLAQQA